MPWYKRYSRYTKTSFCKFLRSSHVPAHMATAFARSYSLPVVSKSAGKLAARLVCLGGFPSSSCLESLKMQKVLWTCHLYLRLMSTTSPCQAKRRIMMLTKAIKLGYRRGGWTYTLMTNAGVLSFSISAEQMARKLDTEAKKLKNCISGIHRHRVSTGPPVHSVHLCKQQVQVCGLC